MRRTGKAAPRAAGERAMRAQHEGGYFGGDFVVVAGALCTIGGWMGSPNTLRVVGCGANELAGCRLPTG